MNYDEIIEKMGAAIYYHSVECPIRRKEIMSYESAEDQNNAYKQAEAALQAFLKTLPEIKYYVNGDTAFKDYTNLLAMRK